MGIMGKGSIAALAAVALIAGPRVAAAQEARSIAVEATGGWAGFVDDATKHHGLVGAGVRLPITPRVSVGPEVFYMIGVGDADTRYLNVVGSVWVDLAPPSAPVVPFVVAGAGYQRQRDIVGTGPYASSEGTFTAGGGVRIHLNDRVYVGADARIGWELHLRTAAHVGVSWPRR